MPSLSKPKYKGTRVLHVTHDLDIAGEGLHNVRDVTHLDKYQFKKEMEDYCDL